VDTPSPSDKAVFSVFTKRVRKNTKLSETADN
jgi:hypothetical protein